MVQDGASTVEGVSHASILRDGVGDRPTSQLYIWIPYGEPALGRRGVRTHRHTLMVEKDATGVTRTVLHDNGEDPYQLENIAEERPDLVQELMETELNPWLEKTRDPWLGA